MPSYQQDSHLRKREDVSKTVEAALTIVELEPQLRERMWSIARRLQSGLKDLGFDIGEPESPITPVYVISGDEKTAMSMISLSPGSPSLLFPVGLFSSV